MNWWYLLIVAPAVIVALYGYSAYKAGQEELNNQFDEWWL